MSFINTDQVVASSDLASQGYGPYEASIASSASSSQVSVFSDNASTQSSVASSISDDFRSGQEDARDTYCAAAQNHIKSRIDLRAGQACPQQLSYADATSVSYVQRQHPRRCSLAKNQKPPPLVRQAERKHNFVDNLVDSATQMVEVIWPLSMVPCQSESGSGRSVLPLRNYIEETLRRSRTSYSTLQVALYYLILIKPFVPKRDFTMEQSNDCPVNRALMCGRRMFLAALILASKYLQDRNYSAKAWSKMSGLRVPEINANERTFLAKIDWKLHVAKPVFDRWTDIVLKYQTMPPSGSPGQSMGIEELCWRSLVPMLTPALDNVPLPERMAQAVAPLTPCSVLSSPVTPTPVRSQLGTMALDAGSQETTPTPANICPPRYLEPRPTIAPPTPALARMGPLPTPQMTPSSIASSTPAVSAFGSRRPSMSSAMAMAQRTGFNRCATDDYPMSGLDRYRSRRPSISSSLSSRSSPESMISDVTRSSRASSISSVTTVSSTASCVAPPRPNLARLATTRCAKMPLPYTDAMLGIKEHEGIIAKPIDLSEEDVVELSPPDFSISEKKLHAPHRHSKHQQRQQPTSAPATEKSRKRHRPTRGNRRSDLYDEVRYQLAEQDDEDTQMIDLVSSDDEVNQSNAAVRATAMLGYDSTLEYKQMAVQPSAALPLRQSTRVPVQKNEGKKRTCCSSRIFG